MAVVALAAAVTMLSGGCAASPPPPTATPASTAAATFPLSPTFPPAAPTGAPLAVPGPSASIAVPSSTPGERFGTEADQQALVALVPPDFRASCEPLPIVLDQVAAVGCSGDGGIVAGYIQYASPESMTTALEARIGALELKEDAAACREGRAGWFTWKFASGGPTQGVEACWLAASDGHPWLAASYVTGGISLLLFNDDSDLASLHKAWATGAYDPVGAAPSPSLEPAPSATASPAPTPAPTAANAPPTGSVRINDNAKTTATTKVTLNLRASDRDGDAIRRMRLSNSGSFATATEETFRRTRTGWTIGGSSRTKTVYVWFQDARGGWSARFSDSIYFNRRPTDKYGCDSSSYQVNYTRYIFVLDDDRDPDGDKLRITAVTQPQVGGSVKVATHPSRPGQDVLLYSPPYNFAGADDFTYTVSDGHGGTLRVKVVVSTTGASCL